MSRVYQKEGIDRVEELRKRYQYSKLILDGKVRLPYRVASRLCGPDRAYHLYRLFSDRPGKGK
ncbi:MAG: hypothetical protein D6778_00220 [Nitrospirae bacterium]|nr:MAG: hypothetical protein D6778_00220 [Nitrospirota bacterium]